MVAADTNTIIIDIMRHIGLYLLLTLMLSGIGTRLSAQEGYDRWAIGLSGVYGDLGNGQGDKGLAFVPSVRYQFAKDWSVTGSLLLPLATEKSDHSHFYTTGLELGLRRDFEIMPKLRLSLSAVGMWGIMGPYKVVNEPFWGVDSSPYPPGHPSTPKIDLKIHDTRYLVGLRPSISYQFASRWSVELGYGFLGYRSSKSNDDTDVLVGKKKREMTWGWNDEMCWGNSLRLGVSYSF